MQRFCVMVNSCLPPSFFFFLRLILYFFELLILYWGIYSSLTDNAVIVSGEEWRNSAIHIHASILSQAPFPSRLLHKSLPPFWLPSHCSLHSPYPASFTSLILPPTDMCHLLPFTWRLQLSAPLHSFPRIHYFSHSLHFFSPCSLTPIFNFTELGLFATLFCKPAKAILLVIISGMNQGNDALEYSDLYPYIHFCPFQVNLFLSKMSFLSVWTSTRGGERPQR